MFLTPTVGALGESYVPMYLRPCRQCRERTRLQDVIDRVESGTETEESGATIFGDA